MTKLFKLSVSDNILKEINLKVKNYPWHEMPNDGGWEYGTNLDYMKEISKYWVSEFDWRKHEKGINKFPNSLPEILTGIRVAVGMCWGTLVAAEFLAGITGIGFVENVARKYMQYEVIWITIFVMGMLGLLFDLTIRKIIDKTIPWRGKG